MSTRTINFHTVFVFMHSRANDVHVHSNFPEPSQITVTSFDIHAKRPDETGANLHVL
jgi:hypothetical protein